MTSEWSTRVLAVQEGENILEMGRASAFGSVTDLSMAEYASAPFVALGRSSFLLAPEIGRKTSPRSPHHVSPKVLYLLLM